MIPNILSIAGSDPSGGAGIQADIKSISANGGYAMAVLTGLTAQNTCGVGAVSLVAPDMIADQIRMIRDDIRIDAVKIGMLGCADTIAAVSKALSGLTAPLVLDPVMVAKSGDRLLAPSAVAALRDLLVSRASVLTPNLPEAADLLDQPQATTADAMEIQGRALLQLGCQAVLIKGGHLKDDTATDHLITAHNAQTVSAPRHPTRNTHGTGCTLSSALATYLGQGAPLSDAVWKAKTYITGAITHAKQLNVGNGHGPVHHFFGHQM